MGMHRPGKGFCVVDGDRTVRHTLHQADVKTDPAFFEQVGGRSVSTRMAKKWGNGLVRDEQILFFWATHSSHSTTCDANEFGRRGRVPTRKVFLGTEGRLELGAAERNGK